MTPRITDAWLTEPATQAVCAALEAGGARALFVGGCVRNALLRQLNARGQSGGGLANIAAQRVLQQNYGNWLDRYNQAGQQGFQAAGAKSNLLASQGDNAYGFAATKANNALGRANALASTRNVGINNLMRAVGTGLNAYSKFYKPKPV